MLNVVIATSVSRSRTAASSGAVQARANACGAAVAATARVRLAAAGLLVVSITSSAAADHVSLAKATVMSSAGYNELVVGSDMAFMGVNIEVIRFDFVDFDGGEDDFEIRGPMLGAAYRIDRRHWGAWFGGHLATVWTNSVRYFTPWAGAWIGEATQLAIELRSAGAYVGIANEQRHSPPARSLSRDFDLEAQLSTPAVGGRFVVRGRYRDIDTGDLHVRDISVAAGLELAVPRGKHRWAPTFVGVGLRRERFRIAAPAGDVVERTVDGPGEPGWNALVWLEIDLGADGFVLE